MKNFRGALKLRNVRKKKQDRTNRNNLSTKRYRKTRLIVQSIQTSKIYNKKRRFLGANGGVGMVEGEDCVEKVC